MAKKFVRGVTGIEDIESYDKTLTNVNDILSDGQDTYVHTKKGKTESYYKLTDSVNQVESTDNTLTISKEDGTVSIANSGLATKEELAVKQGKLTSNTSIGISPNNTLRQLFFYMKTYTEQEGLLRTHIKDVSRPGNENNKEDEFNFILKINQGYQQATFTLNEVDKNKFNSIITTYGVGGTVRINGCLLTLSGNTLTASTALNTTSNLVITFSDII